MPFNVRWPKTQLSQIWFKGFFRLLRCRLILFCFGFDIRFWARAYPLQINKIERANRGKKRTRHFIISSCQWFTLTTEQYSQLADSINFTLPCKRCDRTARNLVIMCVWRTTNATDWIVCRHRGRILRIRFSQLGNMIFFPITSNGARL